MDHFWSVYDDDSCSGVPSGVYMMKNNCSTEIVYDCVAQYDTTWDLIGFVVESCSSDEGLGDLFQGEPYLASDVFYDIDCTQPGYTFAMRASGNCENVYLDGLSAEVLSGTVSITQEGVDWARNWDETTSALNCPGNDGPNYSTRHYTMDKVNTGMCTYDTQGYIVHGELSTTSSSGSDSGNPNSASSSSNSPASISSKSSASSASSSGSPTSVSSTPTGLIAGLAGSIAVILLIVIAVGCYFCKRAKKPAGSSSLYDPMIDRRGTGTNTTAPSDPSTLGTVLWKDETIIATRVPRDQVKIGDLISRGGFGEVYEGLYSREAVAIKMLFPEERTDLNKVNLFLMEAKLMAGLSHPQIVRFVGVSWRSLSDLCILSELMKGGDLRALLKDFDARGHPQGVDSDKIRIAYHVAQALMYLHSLSPTVIHRDLKSSNVLLTENLDAKLTDFGVSREQQENTMTAGVGTLLWMAPEVMMAEKYSEKADIFSFGVLLSELDTQALPYAHARCDSKGNKVPDTAIIQKVCAGALKVAFSSGCLASVVELGHECIAFDPSVRPTAPMLVYRLQTIMRESFRS